TANGLVVELAAAQEARRPQGVVSGGTINLGDGLVFDEGHPEQDEQGGRVAFVRRSTGLRRAQSSRVPPVSLQIKKHGRDARATTQTVEIAFDRGAVNP